MRIQKDKLSNSFILLLIIIFPFTIASCTHLLIVDSKPAGAKVYLDGDYMGTTPLREKYDIIFDFDTNSTRTIDIKKDGYKVETIRIGETTMDGKQLKVDLLPETPQVLAQQYSTYAKSILETSHRNQMLATRYSQTDNRWAIIIGISKYEYSGKEGINNLIFADDDAKAFARTLRNLGWSESHIKLITNKKATKRNIEIALESWLTKAGINDQIILFWAGHGFPDPEDPEKVYFACYDTDISIPATGYRMDKVRTALEERKSKNVILLADTCHAGKLITRGERGISIVPQIDKMQREQQVPKGWIFMVGADTDRKAIEHTSWTNGAFTHSLIKGLSGEADGFQSAGAKDGVVTMGELKDYMNISMPDETQKVLGVAKRPIITTSTGDPDIWNLTLQVKQ